MPAAFFMCNKNLLLLCRDLLARLTSFAEANSDGLLAAGDLLTAATALQLALLHFAHFGLHLLTGSG